jgi:hypothetical protein
MACVDSAVDMGIDIGDKVAAGIIQSKYRVPRM